MPVIQHDALRRFAYDVFCAAGIPDDDARIVSDHLVESHLLGHDSHGTWFVPAYARGMKNKYARWEDHEVIRENPCLAVIDGKGANGIVAVTKALDLAVEKAKKATFGFVGLHNISHIGRLGDYPPRIADQGLLGMVWLNGGGVFMAPFGSADRRLRPEPIAFAAPRRDGPPFMLDMTMTVVAGGKIEQKSLRGEEMPDGWVVDQDGKDVHDPDRYKTDPDNTGVLPLGGLQFGHKGYGLGMMVEMLVGPLSGAGCTKAASGTGGGTMILAIDIEAFTDLDTYKEEVEGLADWVHSAKPLPGFKKVYTPGEIEEEIRAQRLVEGIDLPDKVWDSFGELADELGVERPSL